MKILLLLGALIYFGSRWILGRNNRVGNGKIFFSYILFSAEITTIFTIIGQLLWNIAKWDLSGALRWFGLVLFILGVSLSVYSRIVLGDAYSTARNFSRPSYLVQRGPYGYIRHPIYVGTLLMGLGFELAVTSYLFFVVLLAGTAVIYICVAVEEKKLKQWFPQYAYYQKQTKKFIPFIF